MSTLTLEQEFALEMARNEFDASHLGQIETETRKVIKRVETVFNLACKHTDILNTQIANILSLLDSYENQLECERTKMFAVMMYENLVNGCKSVCPAERLKAFKKEKNTEVDNGYPFSLFNLSSTLLRDLDNYCEHLIVVANILRQYTLAMYHKNNIDFYNGISKKIFEYVGTFGYIVEDLRDEYLNIDGDIEVIDAFSEKELLFAEQGVSHE